MNSTFFRKAIDIGIYSSTILLTFLLVFEQFLVLPSLVSWIGHWHPIILHFPIVLILVTVIQYWRKDTFFPWYLGITTLLTLVSGITGFLLSLEGGTKGELILIHQWMGIAVAFLMVCWYWFFQKPSVSKKYILLLHVCLVLSIILTGHLGGMVTHGEDFLTPEWMKDEPSLTLTEESNVYMDVVRPILDEKCVSCHNSNKSKGELMLSDYASILKGGESGLIIDPNDLENSRIIQAIHFPIDDDKHMPPKDEKQLSPNDMAILTAWVASGASESLLIGEIDQQSELYTLVETEMEKNESQRWANLPSVSNDEIAELSSDYCTIRRLYNQSNALQVLIFPDKTYSSEFVQKLKTISKNIVELNLDNLPLSDKEMKTINSFVNLESLNIGNTGLSNEAFAAMGNMDNLKSLKAFETNIGDEVLNQIALFTNLSELYLYNTQITDEGITDLKSKKADLHIVTVPFQALDFKSVLPTPTVDPQKHFFNEPFYIKLIHPLQGIDILYSRDGKMPNANSPKFSDSLKIDASFKIKYFASKQGWEPSMIDSVEFIETKKLPISYELKNPPNQKYTGKGKEILFDLEKGLDDYTDSSWMAFREEPFLLTAEFDHEFILNGVILSSVVQTDPYLFPPSSIKIYGGRQKDKLILLGELNPEIPKERREKHLEFYTCTTIPASVNFVKIIVEPLQKIPIWHQGKGDRAWFFIDEVVFMDKMSGVL